MLKPEFDSRFLHRMKLSKICEKITFSLTNWSSSSISHRNLLIKEEGLTEEEANLRIISLLKEVFEAIEKLKGIYD